MPPSGIHGLTGLLCAGFIADPYAKLGMVFGSMLPDGDLVVASFAYLATGKVDAGKEIHRSWSHSWVIHASLAGIGGLLCFFHPSWAYFLIGLGTMMALHTLMDYFYVGYMTQKDAEEKIDPGVALWAPISFQKFAWWPKVFSDQGYNVMLSGDFWPDPLLFTGPVLYLAWKYQTNIALFWPFSMISIAFFFIFLGFFIFAIYKSTPSDSFTIALHYPGIIFLILCLLFPFLFWETIAKFCW